MSLAEFLLPIVIVYLLTLIYWRHLWQATSLLIILLLPIFAFFTVKNVSIFSREKDNNVSINENVKSWSRREVLKDFKFYSMLPAILASSFIITGIVINQSFIIESKGWGKFTIAQSFMIYSVLTVATLFFSGFMVDKFTSRKLFPLLNLPLLLSMIIILYHCQSKLVRKV